MFIEHKSHLSSGNNPQQRWSSSEASSSANDHYGQQQISNYQPAPYNERQQYRHDRTKQNASSYNAHKNKKVGNPLHKTCSHNSFCS